MSEQNYQPPKVWEWKQNSGGAFANINRPVSGATHERVLPVGTHPLQLYSLGTPNGQEVTIMLEELLALGATPAPDRLGRTPLHSAAVAGHVSVAATLLDAGVSDLPRPSGGA